MMKALDEAGAQGRLTFQARESDGTEPVFRLIDNPRRPISQEEWSNLTLGLTAHLIDVDLEKDYDNTSTAIHTRNPAGVTAFRDVHLNSREEALNWLKQAAPETMGKTLSAEQQKERRMN